MTRRRRGRDALALTGATLALTACTTMSTGASEVALQYEGGMVESLAYYECFSGSTKEYNDLGDTHYFYPTGGRDFSFSRAETADTAPLSSLTRDNQQLAVLGTVKFSMTLSCDEFTDPSGKTWPGGTAQYFHELYGTKDPSRPVYNVEGNQPYGEGWRNFLEQYVGFAVDRIVDDRAKAFTLAELRGDGSARARWESDVKNQLPDMLKRLLGGVAVFKVTEVVLQQPEVRAEIADAEAQRQAAQITAEAADVDRRAAETFPGGIDAYLEYKRQQSVNKAIESGKVTVLPIPQGSPIIVQPR